MRLELTIIASSLLLLFFIANGFAKAYPLGPNRFLGTCLDAAWVKKMESEKGVSSTERNSRGQLLHPFLQPALKAPRYTVDDPRTASEMAFSDNCMNGWQSFYGAYHTTTSRGDVNGTLVLDMAQWESHALSTMVLAILAEEVVGYKVSISVGGTSADITQRMSSVGSGLCTPTHLNTEGWASSLDALKPYFNESYNAGILGYYGLSGLYTTTDFVIQGASANPPYSPEFWRSYKTSDALINALSVESFKTNSKYYPPAQEFCPDGVLGCEENCGKTEACTEREEAGKSCLVVAMMFPSYDPGYFQAVLANLGIPAYFCFIGVNGVNNFALEAAANNTPVLFYHYEPDLFHVTHKGLFERVFLPRTDPERVKLSTGNFGENGYGSKTDNPVDVDYPRLELMKFAASIVSDLPIGSMFSRFTLSDTHINDLLSKFSGTSHDSSEPEPYFRAACNWVKENYDLWADWIDELPVCTFQKHVSTRIVGCEEGSTIRRVEFEWKSPNPNNNSIPNDCDGGLTTLPSTITTTRSCEWIRNNYRTGSGWVDFKPTCDPSFYDYNLSACDSSGYQSVQYYWKLPNPENHRLSAECQGGDDLPEPSRTKCGSVQSCADFCEAWQRTRTRTYPPRGVSSGLNKRWMDISIALVDNLPPTSAGSDSVIVISDKVSEQASFIPTSSNATLTEIACLFCTEYQVAHGLPRTIVMDRNVDFTSALRKGVIQVFKALTPCTDGKIETTNKLIAEYLRYFLKPHQDKWEDMLEAGEAFYNFHSPSSMHSATALVEPTASGNNRCNEQPF